jgi:predicted membrane channel-forming protein YqfA (hemolysin III family)
MLRKQSSRRLWSVLFILIGAALIFLATDIFNHSGFSGWVLVTLGIAIELAGITIKHK